MGNLTIHLQNRFIECCPLGWVAHREAFLLTPELEQSAGLHIAQYLEFHTDPRFDGARARLHLQKHLAMRVADSTQNAALMPIFQHWLRDHAAAINLHPKGPQFLLPPA
jgi:hypothetical protein